KHEYRAESLLDGVRAIAERLGSTRAFAIEAEMVIRALDAVANDAPAGEMRTARIERANTPVLSAKNHQFPAAQVHGARLSTRQRCGRADRIPGLRMTRKGCRMRRGQWKLYGTRYAPNAACRQLRFAARFRTDSHCVECVDCHGCDGGRRHPTVGRES